MIRVKDLMDDQFDHMRTINDPFAFLGNFPNYAGGFKWRSLPYDAYRFTDEKENMHYGIEMNVAAYDRDSIEAWSENGFLTVKGKVRTRKYSKEKLPSPRSHVIYRMKIGENMEIAEAEINNGILAIDIVEIIPEALKPKKIEIKSAEKRKEKKLETA